MSTDTKTGWKQEVLVDGTWSRDGVVWPDEKSALNAGSNLLMRWFVPTDYRAVAVTEEPNRPTWEEWIAQQGLPPTSVSV